MHASRRPRHCRAEAERPRAGGRGAGRRAAGRRGGPRVFRIDSVGASCVPRGRRSRRSRRARRARKSGGRSTGPGADGRIAGRPTRVSRCPSGRAALASCPPRSSTPPIGQASASRCGPSMPKTQPAGCSAWASTPSSPIALTWSFPSFEDFVRRTLGPLGPVVQCHRLVTCVAWRPDQSWRMQPPSLDDVRAACARVYPFLRPTPLMRHPLLAAESGSGSSRQAREPHADRRVQGPRRHQPRPGALARRARRGIIGCTTGNHGQSMALACRREGVPCRSSRPRATTRTRTPPCGRIGAEVDRIRPRLRRGARSTANICSAERGLRYVHSANEPDLIAGVGTYALEIFDEHARSRRHPGAGRRRQRRLRDCSWSGGALAVGRKSSASRPSGAERSPDRGGTGRGRRAIRPTRSRKAWPRG